MDIEDDGPGSNRVYGGASGELGLDKELGSALSGDVLAAVLLLPLLSGIEIELDRIEPLRFSLFRNPPIIFLRIDWDRVRPLGPGVGVVEDGDSSSVTENESTVLD